MKLKNKKTGEIIETDFELSVSIPDDEKLYGNDTYTQIKGYSSIKELSEEWEDVPEEPKDFWYIGDLMIICGTEGEFTTPDLASFTKKDIEKLKEIGNYFESKEEAEKAVEKLKAWKRLKDKGFRFDLSPALGHCDDKKFDISIIGTMPAKWWYNDKVVDDIHYIFGGEK